MTDLSPQVSSSWPARVPLHDTDWSWAGPPLDTRPLFPLERAGFLDMLRELDAEDWQRPTVCPGWRVHDVAAHVAHDYLRKLSGARDGRAAPGPRPGEDLPLFLHRVNQEFVDVASRWSPRVLVDLLGHLGPQLDQHWASLDLDRLGEAVSWAAPGLPAPAWLDVAREYSEYWVHQQQVRDAVGRPGANDERLTSPVIDAFLRAVPYALRHYAPGPGTCVQVQVTGPGGGTWTITRRTGSWAVERDVPPGPAAALVRLSSDCLWRVATRGITVTTARDRATVSGDQSLGSAVLNLVAIVRLQAPAGKVPPPCHLGRPDRARPHRCAARRRSCAMTTTHGSSPPVTVPSCSGADRWLHTPPGPRPGPAAEHQQRHPGEHPLLETLFGQLIRAGRSRASRRDPVRDPLHMIGLEACRYAR